MYFPYFRGLAEELRAVNEQAAGLVANGKIMPIVEPVNVSSSAIKQCASIFQAAGLTIGVVTNPSVGDVVGQPNVSRTILADVSSTGCNIVPFFLIGLSTQVHDIRNFLTANGKGQIGFIHFDEPSSNVATIVRAMAVASGRSIHLFSDVGCSAQYTGNVTGSVRALLSDGFRKRSTNAQYPDSAPEFFSDLHFTFKARGYDGFGDFLTIGSDYVKGGRQPRAIAIHLTFGDKSKSYCVHFVSKSNQTQSNQPQKYREALLSLQAFDHANPKIFKGSVPVGDFLADLAQKLMTSLGMMKRRSMIRHLELMCTLV